jgi:hypothetical protein
VGKKSIIIGAVVVLLAGAALVALQQARLVDVARLDFSGQTKWLADRSYDFLEDLKYKDFAKSATYHLAATQEKRDIPELIRRVFGVKHEVLDIERFEVLEVDLDRSGLRARVRTQVYFHILGDRTVRESAAGRRDIELLLYWFKQDDGQWVMELESSLR